MGSEVCLLKINPEQVETHPWSPDIYRYMPEESISAFSDSIIRWKQDKETGEVTSNARIVQWSDGSMHLMIGNKTTYRIKKQKNHKFHYIFSSINQLDTVEAQAEVNHKLELIPESKYAKFQQQHHVLKDAEDKTKVQRTGFLAKPSLVIEQANAEEKAQRRKQRNRSHNRTSMSSSFINSFDDSDESDEDLGGGESWGGGQYDDYDSSPEPVQRAPPRPRVQRPVPMDTMIDDTTHGGAMGGRRILESSSDEE